MEPVLELRGVTRTFPGHKAVDDVSLSLERGGFYSLLGPSGCGKTTTLRLVAGFEQPDAGDVLLNGVSVAGRRPFERDVSTVFQNYALFPHLTALGNVEFGLRERGVAGRRERALRALERCGLCAPASTRLSLRAELAGPRADRRRAGRGMHFSRLFGWIESDRYCPRSCHDALRSNSRSIHAGQAHDAPGFAGSAANGRIPRQTTGGRGGGRCGGAGTWRRAQLSGADARGGKVGVVTLRVIVATAAFTAAPIVLSAATAMAMTSSFSSTFFFCSLFVTNEPCIVLVVLPSLTQSRPSLRIRSPRKVSTLAHLGTDAPWRAGSLQLQKGERG